MAIPQDLGATLAVRCRKGIESVLDTHGRDIKITRTGTANGYVLYRLFFPQLGENCVTVNYAQSETSVLQYYSVEPLEPLISRRAEFLATKQFSQSARGYNGAFLQWSMTTRSLITWDNYPVNDGWKKWMCGGSDDLGLAPAAFLSEKNLTQPTQSEIEAIDYHIKHFLLGYLINARDAEGNRTYQVYRWFDGKDGTPEDEGIWRAYNYTHIANTFFNMYQIAKRFKPIKTAYSSKEYLTFAYEILHAMYPKIPLPNPIGDAVNTLGLMGESTVPEIISTLTRESMTTEAATLSSYVSRKLTYYSQQAYPFASEQTIDTTGFESVYTFARTSTSHTALTTKCQKASLAARGRQPLWYFCGSDNRMMGESYWNLGYETQLGAWQQQEYLCHHHPPSSSSDDDEPDFEEAMQSTCEAYLAGWANVNSGQIDAHAENLGAASWLWQSEGRESVWGWMPMVGSWWAWSGECDLGFWGGLRTACVNVVRHSVVGLFAYGGTAEFDEEEGYTIVPADGVRRRFTVYCLGHASVALSGATYTKAIVSPDATAVELELETTMPHAGHVVEIALQYVPAGIWQVYEGGLALGESVDIIDGAKATLSIPTVARAKLTISIRRQATR